ncbi:ATP-binding cassette domain-containing protein, partial [Candidatus Saccharibacteria bacterium]|nr:ATP-binding cassette domain-containing protein [Candidatus Saccharibacteria bacterium]
METVAQLTNVSKRYKNLQVIEDVNLKITDREFLSLIGPNGCGKSTIIKILAGVIDKYSGKIIVPNKTAYVPQQNSLLPWMNVLDNLIFPGVINPDSYLNNKDKAKSLLQEFKLDQFAGYYPQQLSGGMQQKLSILRAVNTS